MTADVRQVDFYDQDTRMEAVRKYLITQSMKKVSEIMGIPRSTLQSWKKQEWFDEAYQKAKKVYDVRMDGKLTDAIDKASEVILDRLMNGDPHVLKDGTVIRKPITARDAVIVLGTAYDKRALSRGDPTSRSQSTSPADMLKQISQELRKISKGEIVDEEQSKQAV